MIEQLRRVIVGQTEVIEQILAAIFTRGHCLLVGVPGLAKTLHGQLDRPDPRRQLQAHPVHAGPDAVRHHRHRRSSTRPRPGRREFRFVKGPIFANIVLADEINRTPPKTQAALLQAMQERQVTVGQETYNLPEPFFVIATQNPIEQEGTYPLPEAQLDRFMFNIKVDYPTLEEEKRILAMTTKDEPAGADQGAERQGDREPAEAGAQRAGRRLRDRLRRAAGAGDAAEGPDGAGVRQARWSTGAPGRGPGIS